MNLSLTLSGFCCDLALHPVDEATAARVCALGEDLYKTNSIEWWRANTNNTCAMRLTPESFIEVTLGDARMPFDAARIATSAAMLHQRQFLESPEAQVCLLGYDDEACSRTWTWRNVTDFTADKFQFFVQRWDRVLGVKDYLVLDDVCYDGRIADEAVWGESRGFSFITPLVVNMDVVRAEFGKTTRKAA